MKYYNQIKTYVDQAHKKANREFVLKHFERTEYWLSQLYPNISESMRIAAYAHDIERAIELLEGEVAFIENESNPSAIDSDLLEYHQLRSAKIIKEKLIEIGAPENMVQEVYFLILKHEVGGNDLQNLLKDADSISFLENNVDHFIVSFTPKIGKEEVKKKFDWMYSRITNSDAKKIAKPFYIRAIENLKSETNS